MAVSLTELKDRISRLNDLTSTAFDAIFNGYDHTHLNSTEKADFYNELEKKSIELFEKIKGGILTGSTTSAASVISNTGIGSWIDAADRLGPTYGSTILSKMTEIDTKANEVETFISAFSTSTDLGDLSTPLEKIDSFVNDGLRKKYYDMLIEQAIKVYGELPEIADSVSNGTSFINELRNKVSALRNHSADASSFVMSTQDFGRKINEEYQNNQAQNIGTEYKNIVDEVRNLKNTLGGDYDDTLTMSAETQLRDKIADYRAGGMKERDVRARYDSILSNRVNDVVADVENFVEIATNDELDNMILAIDEFKAHLDPTVDAAKIVTYDSARRRIETEKTDRATSGRTGMDAAAISAEVTRLDSEVATLTTDKDTAQAERDKEVWRVEYMEKKTSDLDSEKRVLEGMTSRTSEQDVRLDLLRDELNYRNANRATNSDIDLISADIENNLDTLKGSLYAGYDFSIEHDRRRDLKEHMKKSVADLKLEGKTAIENIFGPGAIADKIWTLVNAEISGRESYAAAGNPFALKSLAEVESDRLAATAASNHSLAGLIQAHIDVRNKMVDDWFKYDAELLSNDDLEKVIALEAELKRRKGDVSSKESALTAAASALTAKEDERNKARRKSTLRTYVTEFSTNFSNRKSELDNISNTNTRLNGLLTDAIEFDKQNGYKKACAKILSDLTTKFEGLKIFTLEQIKGKVDSMAAALPELASHPNLDALKTELANEVFRRANKVKKATIDGKKYKGWVHAVCFVGGALLRGGLQFLPGVAAIAVPLGLGYAGISSLASGIGWGANLWASKHPEGKIANIINKTNKKDANGKYVHKGIYSGIRFIRSVFCNKLARTTAWGFTSLDAGIRLYEHFNPSVDLGTTGGGGEVPQPDPTTPDVTPPVPEVPTIEVGSQLDLPVGIKGHRGPGMPAVSLKSSALKGAIVDYIQEVEGVTWVHILQRDGVTGLAHFTKEELEAAGFVVKEVVKATSYGR